MSESTEHALKKAEEALRLAESGYTVGVEYQTSKGYILDVYAVNGDYEVCVEVGRTTTDKVDWAQDSFDEFIHTPYYKDGSVIKGVRQPTTNNAVNVSESSMRIIETIIQESRWKPSKREVVDKALKMLEEKEVPDNDQLDDANTDTN